MSTTRDPAVANNAAPLPDVSGRWGLALLLASGMTLCYAQRGTLSVAAPFMIRELGINTETMGLMLSAFSWCYCFMQVPSGWIVDRFGVGRAYASGFALWSIACALTGAFRNIALIMFFRITMGIGQSVAFPASARTVANWFSDRERGVVNSSYLIGIRSPAERERILTCQARLIHHCPAEPLRQLVRKDRHGSAFGIYFPQAHSGHCHVARRL